jgi:hypothetical protein
MEAVRSSETLVSAYKSIRRYYPEDQHLHYVPKAFTNINCEVW